MRYKYSKWYRFIDINLVTKIYSKLDSIGIKAGIQFKKDKRGEIRWCAVFTARKVMK